MLKTFIGWAGGGERRHRAQQAPMVHDAAVACFAAYGLNPSPGRC